MECLDEEEAAGDDMIDDALGSSWSAPIAALSLVDELGAAAGNSTAWMIVAVVAAAAIFCAWLYSHHRGLTAALREDTQLFGSVLGELLTERRATLATFQPRSAASTPTLPNPDKSVAEHGAKVAAKVSKLSPDPDSEGKVDPFDIWLAAKTFRTKEGSASAAALRESYAAWAVKNELPSLGPTMLGRKLDGVGIKKRKVRGKMVYVGLSIRGDRSAIGAVR